MGDRYPLRREAEQSIEDMTQQLKANAANNRLNRSNSYPVVAAEVKVNTIAAAIDLQREMQDHIKQHGRVDLNDVEAVEETVERYLTACKAAGVVPGISGLAAALGVSRQYLNRYASGEKGKSAKYLASMREMFSAVLEHCALSRTASEPTAIFLMKNNGTGMSDRVDLDVNTSNTLDNTDDLSAEQITQRYATGNNDQSAAIDTSIYERYN